MKKLFPFKKRNSEPNDSHQNKQRPRVQQVFFFFARPFFEVLLLIQLGWSHALSLLFTTICSSARFSLYITTGYTVRHARIHFSQPTLMSLIINLDFFFFPVATLVSIYFENEMVFHKSFFGFEYPFLRHETRQKPERRNGYLPVSKQGRTGQVADFQTIF